MQKRITVHTLLNARKRPFSKWFFPLGGASAPLPPPHFAIELQLFNEVSSRTENDDDNEDVYVKNNYNDYLDEEKDANDIE